MMPAARSQAVPESLPCDQGEIYRQAWLKVIERSCLTWHRRGHPFDPHTLSTTETGGIRVCPEHVYDALRRLSGIADHPHSAKFPLGIPPSEQLVGVWG
jgi:hypothetical protein